MSRAIAEYIDTIAASGGITASKLCQRAGLGQNVLATVRAGKSMTVKSLQIILRYAFKHKATKPLATKHNLYDIVIGHAPRSLYAAKKRKATKAKTHKRRVQGKRGNAQRVDAGQHRASSAG